MASAWTANKAVEEARKKAERKAFEKLLNQLSLMWKDVVEQYAER
jgi:hypothetical protein